MVPLADLFNHKAAVVQLGGGYALEDACFGMPSSDEEASSSEPDEGDSDADAEAAGPATSDGAASDNEELLQVQ